MDSVDTSFCHNLWAAFFPKVANVWNNTAKSFFALHLSFMYQLEAVVMPNLVVCISHINEDGVRPKVVYEPVNGKFIVSVQLI